jgi:2-polyprenyl-3-methyl-5-hydroxy-6-metoxy-1,4-benzoquinol methylase
MQNSAFLKKDADYYTMFKWWMLPHVHDGANAVLDLGCGSGVMGRKLRETGKATEVVGVEIFPSAAAEAEKFYQKVHVGDIEEMTLDYAGHFDYVICGDVLEHLKDPYQVMRKIYQWLKPGGKVLVCLPNVRNYHVVRDLIFRGKWEYAAAGIMDKTHLRFFTRSSCRQMIKDAGFEVCHQQVIIEGPKKNFFNGVTFGLFREFLAAQIFIVGEKRK